MPQVIYDKCRAVLFGVGLSKGAQYCLELKNFWSKLYIRLQNVVSFKSLRHYNLHVPGGYSDSLLLRDPGFFPDVYHYR